MTQLHPLVKLYRKAKAAKGQAFATRVARKYFHARYAAEDGPTVAKYAHDPDFERKHPRGQPENAGEFAEVHATIGDKPGEGVHLRLPHGSTVVSPEQQAREQQPDSGTLDLSQPGESAEAISSFGSDVKLMEGEQPAVAPTSGTDPEPMTPEPEELSKLESSLTSSAVKHYEELPRKSKNRVFLVTMEDGTQGVFKPTSGEMRLRQDVPLGGYVMREVGTYEAAKLWGMADLVPVTTKRTVEDQEGSCQLYVGNAKTAFAVAYGEDEVPLASQGQNPAAYDGPRDAARAAAFDFLMGNSDRHLGNWLIDDNGRIVLIDNGLTMPERNRKATVEIMCDKNLLEKHYKDLPLSEVTASLTDEVLDAMEKTFAKLGFSKEAIVAWDERAEVLREAKTYGEAIQALHEKASA